ncbi:hypothetical protein LINPERHAP1_LOCUS13953 [Linum perenne]
MMFPITVSGSAGLSLGRSRPYHGRHRQHAGRPLIPWTKNHIIYIYIYTLEGREK